MDFNALRKPRLLVLSTPYQLLLSPSNQSEEIFAHIIPQQSNVKHRIKGHGHLLYATQNVPGLCPAVGRIISHVQIVFIGTTYFMVSLLPVDAILPHAYPSE